MRRKKRNHLFHYNLDEHENYGIGSNLLGAPVEKSATRRRSPTVFNLGYDGAMAARLPWVRAGYRHDHGEGRRSRG